MALRKLTFDFGDGEDESPLIGQDDDTMIEELNVGLLNLRKVLRSFGIDEMDLEGIVSVLVNSANPAPFEPVKAKSPKVTVPTQIALPKHEPEPEPLCTSEELAVSESLAVNNNQSDKDKPPPRTKKVPKSLNPVQETKRKQAKVITKVSKKKLQRQPKVPPQSHVQPANKPAPAEPVDNDSTTKRVTKTTKGRDAKAAANPPSSIQVATTTKIKAMSRLTVEQHDRQLDQVKSLPELATNTAGFKDLDRYRGKGGQHLEFDSSGPQIKKRSENALRIPPKLFQASGRDASYEHQKLLIEQNASARQHVILQGILPQDCEIEDLIRDIITTTHQKNGKARSLK
ncbi:hypothetical protein HDU76_011594 [Blyttiomyces sp. JEL0837]|nr:hypothetical protein HDU76_011594 [Blyttiomyces sp. JEL0837]